MSPSGPLPARAKALLVAATLADALMLGGLAVVLLWHWVAASALWHGTGGGYLVARVSLANLEWWLLGTGPLLAVVLGAADHRGGVAPGGRRALVIVLAAVSGLIGLMAVVARIVVGSTVRPASNWRFIILVATLCTGLLVLSALGRRIIAIVSRPGCAWAAVALLGAGAFVAGHVAPVPGRVVAGLAGIALGYWAGDRVAAHPAGRWRSGDGLVPPVVASGNQNLGADRRWAWLGLAAGLTVVALVTGTGAYPLPLDGRTGWAGTTALPGALFALGAIVVLTCGYSLLGSARPQRSQPRPSDVALVRTLAAVRLAAWGWLGFTYLSRWGDVAHPVPVRWMFVVATALSLLLAWLAWNHPASAVGPLAVLGELALAVALVTLDPWLFAAGRGGPIFWGLWPVVAVLAVAIAWGGWRGAAAGVAIGLARLTTLLTHTTPGTSTIPTAVAFFALAGAALGYLTALLRQSEAEVATARVREEMSLRLHDGVLQTLGIVRRRTDDPILANLARESERELRDYLYATTPTRQHTELGDGLRKAASRCEQVFGVTAHVFIPDDLPKPDEGVADGLLGATSELLGNVGKHASAQNVYLFVEPSDDGLLLSVRDDGCGFDEAQVTTGQGLRASVRGRIAEIGGRVEIRSNPGEGTEVCLWVP